MMFITDRKILELFDMLKNMGIVPSKTDIYKEIGLQRSNVSLIRTQTDKQAYHFTVDQIIRICDAYGVNPSWLFGYDTKVFRTRTAQKLHKNIEENIA